MVLFRNGKGLCAGGGVRHRRAAGDHVQRVAEDVTEHDAEHLCRGTGLRKPSALDSGKPLADGVHFHDIGPAGEKLACDVLQLFPGQQRPLEQCAAAAGEQEQHSILCRQALHKGQRLFGDSKAVLVRDRMACFTAGHARDLTLYVAVFGHHHTAVHTAQCFHRSVCHLPGRLARCHQQHSAAPRRKGFQRTAHGFVWQNGVQAGADDGICIPSQSRIHKAFLH